MVRLQFSSMEELKNQGELQPDHKNKFHKMTCEQVFESYIKLFSKANLIAEDPENQYILFSRCGALGQMIMRKNGFPGFKEADKKKLAVTFKTIISKMEALETLLSKGYAEKNNPSAIPNIAQPLPPEVPQKEILPVKSKVTIQPRELVRIVEQEKKSAVILDFREDQEKAVICYTKGDIHPIVFVAIPRKLVVPGLLFSSLKVQIPVAQRPLLNKIPTFEYVVIMDHEGISLDNGEPAPNTPAGILKLALTEYNISDKLKHEPIFMEGGFENWNLQYPMYVHRVKKDGPVFDSVLEDMISNYKTAKLPFKYPELSVDRVVEKSPKTSGAVSNQGPTVPSVIPTSMSTLPTDVQENLALDTETTKILPNVRDHPVVPERTTKPNDTPKADVKVIPTSNASPKLQRLAGGHSNISVDRKPDLPSNTVDIKVSDSSINIRPLVDRGNKPDETPKATTPQPPFNPKPTVVPSLDRSTKPVLPIAPDQLQKLVEIYVNVAKNLADSAVQRNTIRPGQTGLYNLGNTCFMNACLQALFQTPFLLDTFSRDKFTRKVNVINKLGTKGVMTAVFSALMDSIWSGECSAITPRVFQGVFSKEISGMLMNGQQQDASEFYVMLLASLHEDTNEIVKGTPPIQNYFGGADIRKEGIDFDRNQKQFSISPISKIFHPRTVSEVTCASCRAQSVTFEDINIIQVELPPPSLGRASLVDCLHRTFSSTNLDGKWNCPRCKVARPASQKRSLWSLSPVIHLLRFSFAGGDFVKNDIAISFDAEHLDMNPFLHPSADRTTNSYCLYSVTNHRGRLNSGHYTAYSRHLRTGEWFRYDDESVNPGRISDINFSDAYILYFKLKK